MVLCCEKALHEAADLLLQPFAVRRQLPSGRQNRIRGLSGLRRGSRYPADLCRYLFGSGRRALGVQRNFPGCGGLLLDSG